MFSNILKQFVYCIINQTEKHLKYDFFLFCIFPFLSSLELFFCVDILRELQIIMGLAEIFNFPDVQRMRKYCMQFVVF